MAKKALQTQQLPKTGSNKIINIWQQQQQQQLALPFEVAAAIGK